MDLDEYRSRSHMESHSHRRRGTGRRARSGALGLTLARLDDAQRAEVRATMERNAEPFRTDGGGYAFPGVALIAAAS